MLLALAVLDERLDVVVVQSRLVAHVSGSNLERPAGWLVAGIQQRRAEQIVKRVAERRTTGLAFRFTRTATSSSRVTVVRMLMMLPVWHQKHHGQDEAADSLPARGYRRACG